MGPVLRRWTFVCTLSRLLQFQLHRPGVTRPKPSWTWEQETRLTLHEHDDDDDDDEKGMFATI